MNLGQSTWHVLLAKCCFFLSLYYCVRIIVQFFNGRTRIMNKANEQSRAKKPKWTRFFPVLVFFWLLHISFSLPIHFFTVEKISRFFLTQHKKKPTILVSFVFFLFAYPFIFVTKYCLCIFFCVLLLIIYIIRLVINNCDM